MGKNAIIKYSLHAWLICEISLGFYDTVVIQANTIRSLDKRIIWLSNAALLYSLEIIVRKIVVVVMSSARSSEWKIVLDKMLHAFHE